MMYRNPDRAEADALTISRYIKSCLNLKQLEVCDNILWFYKEKYLGYVSSLVLLFGREYPDWFAGLVAEYETKELQLLRKENRL